MTIDPTRLSKFLSLVLRHKPETIGLALDPQGWTSLEDLVAKATAAGTPCTLSDVLHVVETSDKQRFSLSPDRTRIRAAQGHSVEVNLGLAPGVPPATLFHGTATRHLATILAEGLSPQSRRQVHLSTDAATALRVGSRHGTPVVLGVEAGRMLTEGFQFFRADNGVWLTDRVPPEFLTTPPACPQRSDK